MTHELKTWSSLFSEVWERRKLFELRKYDRPFRAGDVLLLREYDPDTKKYSGRFVRATVTFMMTGPILGLATGWALMSINIAERGVE